MYLFILIRVCGSYAALNGGFISDGLHDFTGGAYKTFNLSKASDNLWDLMEQAVKRRAVMGCGTPPGVIIHTCIHTHTKDTLVLYPALKWYSCSC